MKAGVQRRIGDEIMRKIVSILTACLMLVSAVVFPAYAAVTDVLDTPYEEAAELLSRLGVAEVEEGYYYPEKSITKVEFLVMTMRMLGFRDDMAAGEKEQLFYDVEPGAYGAGYVDAAYQQGIIFGNGDGFFGADKNITVNEALSMLLRAMKYDVMAEENGGYPAGYVTVARRLDLLTGVQVDSTGYLNRGTTAQLILNALKTKPVMGILSGGQKQYTASSDETLMEFIFGVHTAEGVIDGNRFVSLPDGGGVEDGQITIDQVRYDIEEEYEGKYLGYQVKAYYTEQGGIRKILYLDVSDNTVYQISARDGESYVPGAFTYYPENSDREKVLKLSPYAVTVWNNNVVKMDDAGLELPDYGRITLVDNTGNGQIDAVHITAYDVIVLGAIDSNAKMLYNKKDTSKNINLTEYDKYYLYDENGAEIELSAMTPDSVLEVCASADKKFIEIYQVQRQAEFAVRSKVEREGEIYVIDDAGTQYRLGRAFYQYHALDEILLGNSYKFVLNREGDIVSILTADGTALSYGYLAKCVLQDSSFSQELMFKIFTMDEEFIETQSSGKIKLYGTGKSVQPRELAESLKKPQLIRYMLDSAGNLKTIDIASAEMFELGFRQLGSVPTGKNAKENRYKNGSKTIGGQILIGSNTRAVITPDENNLDDEDGYSVASSAYFDDDEYYPGAVAYSSNPNSVAAEIVIIPGKESTVGYSSPMMLVTDIGSTLTADGLPTPSLNGWVSGKEAAYAVADNVSLDYEIKVDNVTRAIPVEAGDVVQFGTNNKGEVIKVNILYDLSENQVYGYSGGFDVKPGSTPVAFAEQARQNLGTPVKMVDNCLFIQHEGFDAMSNDIFVMTNAYVYEYDSAESGKRRFRAISYHDIVTRNDDPSLNSKIFISLRYSEPKIAVVYK